jgi:lysine 2,3-aminomutase
MLCRHCMRKREWRYGGWVRSWSEIEAMLDYLRGNTKVREVILSGGDPLTLSTTRLEAIISRIREIKHVGIIRIGSRFPVVLPQRIDAELSEMLSKYGLRGINDNLETQLKLCQGLLKIKVRPYYLFQCDEVQGTEHLRTPVEVGIRIIEGMRGHTSGLAVPHFAIDLVNGGGKVTLQPDYVLSMNEDELLVRNYEGKVFRYRNPNSRDRREESVSPPPVSGAVASLLEDADLPVKSTGDSDADRVIV